MRLAVVLLGGLLYLAGPAFAAEPARAATLPAQPAAAPNAAPFLWEITGPKARHYLLGSVHLLPAAAHPLPAALEAAYAASRTVVFEADLESLSDPDLQGRMLGAARDERPGGLQARIGKALYQKLQKRAGALGMPTPVCADLRGWFCALELELFPLQQADFAVEFGVDQYFYSRAQEDGRPTAGLETADEQVELFTGMSDALSKQILAATLDESTYTSQTPEELYRIWRTGDAAAMDRLIREMQRRYPELHTRLLAARNRAWLPSLVERLNGEGPQLVIVGAAHLVGPEGLVALLKAKGFDVRPSPGEVEAAKPPAT